MTDLSWSFNCEKEGENEKKEMYGQQSENIGSQILTKKTQDFERGLNQLFNTMRTNRNKHTHTHTHTHGHTYTHTRSLSHQRSSFCNFEVHA